MNAELLLTHFNRISDAPNAVPRLRRFILDLAVRGRLADQLPTEVHPSSFIVHANANSRMMSDVLPNNWVVGTVGSFLNFQYGKGLHETSRLEVGPVPVYGSNGIVAYTSKALAESAAIIIGRKGSAGALNLSNRPSWTTDVAYFLEPPDFFDIRYLYFALQTLDLDKLGKGVKPGLSRNDAYDLPLSVPPLPEQHRIVAKIDELMALCDRLEAAQQEQKSRLDLLAAATQYHINNGTDAEALRSNLHFFVDQLPRLTTHTDHIQKLRETIFNFAVQGKLVAHDSSDRSASELIAHIRAEQQRLIKAGLIPKRKAFASESPIGLAAERPNNWQAVSFDSLCNMVTSGSRGWAEYYSDSGPKFIRAQNIRFGRLRLDDLACVSPPARSEGTRTQISKGDLLIVITGAGVTNPAMMENDIGEAYVSQHVALIKPTDTGLSPWLLLFLMAQKGGRAALVERAYGCNLDR